MILTTHPTYKYSSIINKRRFQFEHVCVS